jgi:hypothetical protein
MFQNKPTDFDEISKETEILDRASLSPTRGMRWAKLLDNAEGSLYWLIPAITLAYLVFRILPLLAS